MAEFPKMMADDIRERYLDDAVATNYDRERFTSVAGATFDRLEKQTLSALLRRVTDAVPEPRVLDAPCGTGRITKFLLSKGLNVTGGDISVAMMQVACARCASFGTRASWQRLDLERIDMPDNSFDLVTSIRLFHHLETDARGRILREIGRVSRRYVIVNMSFSSPIYRLRRRLKQKLGLPNSATSSTREEITREVAEAGLRIEAERFVLPLVSEDLLLLLSKK